MRVAVIGSTGQLGTEVIAALQASSQYTSVSFARAEVDCTRLDSVQTALRLARPDVVVNCAAFVQVDDSEDRVEEALRVNAIGARNVAQTCAELGALCAYVSTDFVFDGEKGVPYDERDCPRPINAYGASKLLGEHFVRQVAPQWLIVRTASLFGRAGSRGKGGNFIETVLARARDGLPLRVVSDIWMSPTYARDLAGALVDLLGKRARGTVHLTNDGVCTWYEFAAAILSISGVRADLSAITAGEYSFKALRPRNSALVSVHIPPLLGSRLRPWPDAVGAYLQEREAAKSGSGH
jgi:dTDP-4-dehydrorhamnose reductase